MTVKMEFKAVPAGGITVVDEQRGIVEAVVSVTGVVDEVKDVIEPGAYEKTLAKRTPKGVWSHAWDKPIARTIEAKELMPGDPALPKRTQDGKAWPREAGALMVKMQFNLATERGRDAYEDVKFFGEESQWSVGYQVPMAGAVVEQKSGVRRIKTMELYEFSPVLFGAMPMAVTQSIKALKDAAEKEHPFLDKDADGECDICGADEDEHGQTMGSGEKKVRRVRSAEGEDHSSRSHPGLDRPYAGSRFGLSANEVGLLSGIEVASEEKSHEFRLYPDDHCDDCVLAGW